MIQLARRHAPEQRVWTRRSEQAIHRALREARTDDEHLIVNLGAGFEHVFQNAFADVPDLVRVGLPHSGRVDVYGDVTSLPLTDSSVSLFMSSSVMEHVSDPEQGVAEMSRVMAPGGSVYAEIPFIRSYHMAPYDFQRYTISGIERLFGRHGFELIEKGVCSGPFTAWSLLLYDTVCSVTKMLPGPVATAIQGLVSLLVHPIKYFDRLVENSPLAEFQACNFYYVGRRVSE
jgi:SAM-dependent methyltransferase